jgi:amino-acid N-acetyltransferase
MQDVVDGIPIVSIAIERAHRHDQSDIFRLVEQNHLPLAGLEEHLDTALVARGDGRIVGTAAVEMYEDGALLRSVTVAPDAQRKGIGHRLTDAALALARELGAPAVYLLTTTAEQFFPKFGFERNPRNDVPVGVQQSVEFTSACCPSAVVMRRVLEGERS